MFNKELANKIDELIMEKFPVIYEYKFDGIVLLYGGTIRNLILNMPTKDLDFVILTQGECQIVDFIKKYRLRYFKNAGGGYKISYNNFSVDLISKNDLFDTGVYDSDMLFYDVGMHMFISCGALISFQNRVITEINSQKEPLYSNKLRLKKIIKFIKYVSHSNKRVKVKQNKLLWEYKMFIKRIRINLNKITKGNFRKCFRFLKNCKKEFSIMLLISFLVTFISVIIPSLSGKIITSITAKNSYLLFVNALLFVVLSVVSVILSYFLSDLYLIVRKKMISNIRRDVAKQVLNFEIDSISSNNRGTFLNKLKNDPNEIVKAFNGIKNILISGLGNFGALLYIFFLDYRIGLVLLLFMFIIFKIKITGIRKKRKYRMTYFYDQERCTSVLGEMINGVNDIKTLNLKDNYAKKIEEPFVSSTENSYKGAHYKLLYNKVAKFAEFSAMGIVLLLGLFLVQKGSLDASSLIVICMYNSSVFVFLDKLGMLVDYFSDLNISCYRIFNIIDGNLYAREVFGNKYNNNCNGDIEFDKVKFKYSSKFNYVINECTFKIDASKTVALVGKSGEGKTTILNLIARLYNVDDGVLKIDGIDINEYSEEFIRDNISVISQNPYLFDMSIKDNFRLVKEDITDSEIEEVCKLVCLDEFIETLPKKYDTVIGEGGVKLSGGQKQRLAIARALIKKTKIILLDEITSALDNETSSSIKKVINNIQKDHTIIIVTHELSMIKDCDRILVLDGGKIVGDGKHQELVKNNVVYKNLYKIK